jgi:hypothetical protein
VCRNHFMKYPFAISVTLPSFHLRDLHVAQFLQSRQFSLNLSNSRYISRYIFDSNSILNNDEDTRNVVS